ncbi:MAG: phenylacetate-CoA ligase, partial [Gammaproteobacteria bacterium]
MSEFYDSLETRPPDERQAAQLEALRQQLKHAQSNSTAYAEILLGIDSDAITDSAAFSEVPLTRKSDLIALQWLNRPLGGYNTTKGEQHSHLFASPGPIYEPGYRSPDFWRLARALYASGFRSGELVHNCFSYHLTPAGMMLESGALALGCSVTPAGVGQTELQLQTISDLKPQGYVGTPSFLKIILDKAVELKTDLSSMNKALVSGEALPPSLREDFAEQGIRVQQCYATADLGLIGYESSALEGLIIDEGIYVEIVRPGTGEAV